MFNLENNFKTVSRKFSHDEAEIENLWQTVVKKHSGSARHYHNLSHLEHLLLELTRVQDKLQSWDSAIYSIAFHDIIYSVHRKDNEERSAEFAQQALLRLSVPISIVDKCFKTILATKSHTLSDDNDINYFTDADLSILGASADRYAGYARAVRQEYRLYPDLVYRPGRRKVLQHFLTMDKIFKTEEFFSAYEISARKNLAEELRLLA